MNSDFFAGNRQRLYKDLKPSSVFALAAFTAMQGDNDEPALFHQEANFWYLTGLEEANWRLFADIDSGEEWLVAPHVDFVHLMFHGGMSPEQASAISGVQKVLNKREGSALLKKLLASKKQAYTVISQNMRRYGFVPNPGPRRLSAELKKLPVTDVRLPLARLRAIKQPVEIATMQKAIDITLDGFETLLPQLKTMHNECEVDARLTYEFRRRGVVHGFEPIVAAGKNTCVLHHPLPKDPIVQNDWLLLDIGAKVGGYSADITRTIPIGQPSARHLQVYQAVHNMHEYAFSLLKHGISAKEYTDKAYQRVGEELVSLGVISTIKLDYTSVFKFMPHAVSHGLGVDVHDPLGRPEFLQENMTLTVEVGAYIPDEGIGVRLEDDVLITKTGAINMSKRVPIELDRLRAML